ncbi:apelin receptor early endogenous ligand [Echinops telfairi]|uniref:Apelin receptor early endogenous ligand n=1 Tax=Echinops telfairi TaxID=9371 RepID=A0AC55DIZ5_ECHTE|nr:apelin receptor early endogenous ligand [Echinops telfairi]
MRLPQSFFVLFILMTSLLLVNGFKPVTKKKSHRPYCLHRRCRPLHSRVPFP